MLQDINTINKLAATLKVLNILRTALTVGIIAFTVFRIVNIVREE
jgi:hypothetical protein